MLVRVRTQYVALALAAILGAMMVTETVLLASGLAAGSLSSNSTVLYDILVVGAALLCGWRALTRRVDRTAWWLMTCALAFWATGELYYDIVFASAATVPIPSVSDIFWLAFYVPAYASLALLARSRLPRIAGTLWLDGLIGALGIGSLFAAVIFDTVLHHTHGSSGVVATRLAYPIGDLVLLALLVGIAVASGRTVWASPFLLLLGAGFATFCLGDSVYLAQTANNSYHSSGLLDATWPLALLLIGCAAWAPARRHVAPPHGRSGVITPIGLGLVGLGVLIVDHFQRTNLLALTLAGASIVAVAVRLILAFRDTRLAANANALARDEAVEASNAKSMFVATVSHELRTPLNGVIGMTDLLLDTPLTGQQREYAEIVRSSGEGLLLIINDILDYSKMEAGKVELESTNFALRETIAEGCAMLLAVARAKGIELAVVADGDLPAWLRGDAPRLRQVVVNLVSNAVKFTADGTVTVHIRSTQAGGSTIVRVEVVDTGIGIEPKTLGRLFQPFVQADNTTARRYGGTGLGLTISAQLIEMMGGKIGALSEPGTGSTFWFEVPLLPAHSAEERPPEAPPTGPLGERDATGALTDSSPVVLVAEDSQVNQILAVRLLDQCGYRCDVVSDGLQALRAIEQTRYAAVLMDCQMPELDGYDATREIRRRENGTSRLPVIAMTAHTMSGDREKCLAAGMDDYVSKPIRLQVLGHTLARWVAEAPRPRTAADTGSHADDEVLDRAVVAELLQLDPEVAREVVTLYFEDAAAQLPLLARAVAQEDSETVESLAHRFKGASLSVGAALVASIAAELEARARDDDLTLARQLVGLLERELVTTRSALAGEFPAGDSGLPSL